MPPLWLIIGTVIIIGLTSAIDRMILKPRGASVMVDGKTVTVRRKRDVQLTTALMVTMLVSVFVAGVALIEGGNVTFVLFLAVPFATFALWAIWRGLREGDRFPTENDVRAGTRTNKVVNRHARQAFILFAVEFALTAVVGSTDGILSWTILLVSLALLPVVVWHTWQFLRALREIGSEGQSG